MSLEARELNEVILKVTNFITNEINIANRSNELEKYLHSIGCDHCLIEYNTIYNQRDAKILVVGDSHISQDDMCKIAKELCINPKRIEFLLDYDKIKNFNFASLEYNVNFSDIIIGPIPHKVAGLKKNASILSMFDKSPERYPKVIKAMCNGELKFSKESFKKAIMLTQQYTSLTN